jgi:hypothetical protein
MKLRQIRSFHSIAETPPSRPRIKPDRTAVRVALWWALHVELDPPPHMLMDELGLKLAAPGDKWRRRPDMHPEGTRQFRASVVKSDAFHQLLQPAGDADRSRLGCRQFAVADCGIDESIGDNINRESNKCSGTNTRRVPQFGFTSAEPNTPSLLAATLATSDSDLFGINVFKVSF